MKIRRGSDDLRRSGMNVQVMTTHLQMSSFALISRFACFRTLAWPAFVFWPYSCTCLSNETPNVESKESERIPSDSGFTVI